MYSIVSRLEGSNGIPLKNIGYKMEITIMLEVADTKCQITGTLEKCMSD